MAKLMGQLSCTACAGRTGEHKHMALLSWQQLLLAATGSPEENMLPLLRYWLSSIGPWRVTSFLFMWNEIFDGDCEKLLPTKAVTIASPNLSISHIDLWVKMWYRNKTTYQVSGRAFIFFVWILLVSGYPKWFSETLRQVNSGQISSQLQISGS